VKVFQGEDLDAFREDVRAEFEYLRTVSPPASRDSSSEVYLVAKGLNTAPVAAGDRIEVTVEERGDEGDGSRTSRGTRFSSPTPMSARR